MSHAVHYRSDEVGTRFEELATLDDALARVEQLRNEQGVSEVRVYREVPVAFRAYYKATVVDEHAAPTPPSGPTSQPAAEPAAEPQEPVAAEAADSAAAPSSPSSPPPGAMPLTPPSPSANGRPDEAEAGADRGGRGSLFGRG